MNDGLIDNRKDTTNLTASWNVLAENNKSFGIGWTGNVVVNSSGKQQSGGAPGRHRRLTGVS
ncbi:hypothetical protein [Actinosynnema pretiosum]|uniref:hypothetical protein n=1 Tax=Actinosynnema pretiosum TaxID=42197 RepID=UPI0018E064FE|nr:hypothetical protein [Actinosynnema pretiosum]